VPNRRVSWPVIAVFATLVVLVWPLQAVVIGMLLACAVMVADSYVVWMDRRPPGHVRGPATRRAIDQRVFFGLGVVAVLGAVVAMAAPVTMGLVAIALVLAAALASSLVQALVARPAPTAVAGAVDTNEPGFWAGPPPEDLAPVAPMPDPEPQPQPVPARAASPRASRRPSPRPRRSPPAPAHQPVATRRRSRARV
jgi:hypothetical protein